MDKCSTSCFLVATRRSQSRRRAAIRRAAGDFEVEIQPPLEHPAGAKKHERLLHVASQTARRLEPYVQEYAGQWLG